MRLFVLLLVLHLPATALAEGAVAFGKVNGPFYNASFLSFDQPTREVARREALELCRKHAQHCQIRHEYRQTCIAVVSSWLFHQGEPSIGFGRTVAEAKAKSEAICSYVNCRANFLKCDSVSESPIAPKVSSKREPSDDQQKALDHIQKVWSEAIRDAIGDVLIGAALGAFFGWATKLGRKASGRSAFEPQRSIHEVAVGALSAAALVASYDIIQGNLPNAMLGGFEYILQRHGDEFGIFALFTVIPLGLFVMFGGVAFFVACFVGGAFAIYKGLKDLTTFLRGLGMMLAYIFRRG